MKQQLLANLQKMMIVLSGAGIVFVIIGIILDNTTFWAIADSVFISVFLGAAIMFYLSWKNAK
jgi:5-bromo-4-chloroindolyl phosphate hydrolysis protein